MRDAGAFTATLAVLLLALVTSGCEREKRTFEPPKDSQPTVDATRMGDLQPVTGQAIPGKPADPASHDYHEEENAQALADGKRLFKWYNCNGCHAQGGGGMGPALMDDQWIYGSEPANVFKTIVEGRPNGMPAFGARIPEHQVWAIVAYVRSMSGLAPADAAPSRDDALHARKPENRAEPSPGATTPGTRP